MSRHNKRRRELRKRAAHGMYKLTPLEIQKLLKHGKRLRWA